MSEVCEEKYFLSYSGVRLPLKLVSPIESESIENRNTYFVASFNDSGLLLQVVKKVYGEVELRHEYSYDDQGQLLEAKITNLDGEVQVVKPRV
ncbi:DUF6156 family protein [Sessilibacter sp. MAH2]